MQVNLLPAQVSLLDPISLVLPLCLGVGAYLAVLCIYRLYFHPLAKFPGPRLAAVTTWYEGYYDIIHKGRYIFEVGRMHQKYGR